MERNRSKILAISMVALMMFSGLAIMFNGSENSDADGTTPTGYLLYGMGQNNYGQQGDGTTLVVKTPTQIGSFTNVTDVVCSSNTTFFIDSGKLYGMGYNQYGQLGNSDTTTNITTPTQIGSFTNVTDVVCSSNTTFFIDSGKLYGMGRNNNGQQGDGATTNVTTPTQIGSFTNVTDVVCSSNTTFFIDSGKLYGMGQNNYGQQGDGTTTRVTTPKQIGSTLGNIASVVSVLDGYTTFFLTSDGKLYGMGSNNGGQQGDGTTTNVTTPKQIGSTLGTISDVDCSGNTTFFLTSDGKLYGMGANSSGQQGDGTTTDVTTPTQIGSTLGTISDVDCSNATTFFLTSDGKLYGMGQNNYGQLGNSDTTTNITTPTQIGSTLGTISDVDCSSATTFFLTSDGKLYGMGYNNVGQQGDGTTTNVTTPTQVGSTLGTISDIVSGYDTTFFLVSSTATATIQSNNTDYGTVSTSSITDIEPGTAITINDNVLTISTFGSVTATPTTNTDQYTYQFTGWYDGSTLLETGDTIDADVTITAAFTRTLNQYVVSISSNNSAYGDVDTASLTLDYGTSYTVSDNTVTFGSAPDTDTVTATAETDTAQYMYAFTGWTSGGSALTDGTVTGALSIAANFTQTLNQYTITWSIDGTTTTEQYDYGATPTHEDPVKTGYVFTGWNPTISEVTQDQTYTAVFVEAIPVTVTFDPVKGKITEGPTSKTVLEGSAIGDLPTANRPGYSFTGWFTEPTDGTQVTSETIVTGTEDFTLYAQYELNDSLKPVKTLTDVIPVLLVAGLILAIVGTALWFRYR